MGILAILLKISVGGLFCAPSFIPVCSSWEVDRSENRGGFLVCFPTVSPVSQHDYQTPPVYCCSFCFFSS